MKKERTCWICEECERLRLQAGRKGVRVEKERPIGFICAEHGRFLLFGPTPKTRHAVDELARDLKLQLGLSKTPGRKAAARPNILEIEEQILKNEERASLKDIAAQMGVTPRAIREAIRDGIGAPEATFKQYQALVFQQNSKKSRNKTRLFVSKLKKSRRMF